MPQKTDAELLTEAGVIKNETTPAANSAPRVGGMIENVVESKVNNSRMGYKLYAATIGYNGSTFTITEHVKEIDGNVSYSVAGNGLLFLTSSTNAWTTGKAKMINSSCVAGAAYFAFGIPLSTAVFSLALILHDGTQSSTPNFQDFYFEIKVYN